MSKRKLQQYIAFFFLYNKNEVYMKNKKKLIIICSVILAATAAIMICLLTLGKNDKINEEKNPEISEEEIVKKGLDEFVEILNNNDDVYDFCDEYRTMMGATLNWKEEKYNMFSDFEGVLYACLYDTNYEYVSNDFGGMFLASKEEHENMMGYFTDDKLTKFIDSEDYNYCV